MKISYLGIKDGYRHGEIAYRNIEETKADYILSVLKANGIKFFLSGDYETSAALFTVEDREEYEEIKEIYLEAKRSWKK